MKLTVITAGLSEPSSTRMLGDGLAEAAARSWAELAGGAEPLEINSIELRSLAKDLTNQMLTRVPSPALGDALASVTASDAVIAVTPVFNASYSGLFKSFFDVLDEGTLVGRPVLLAATGGTARHSLAIDQAMVPLFFYLRADVVPTPVFAATDDWGDNASHLTRRMAAAGEALVRRLLQAPVREAEDPFADVTPFAELLGR